MAMELVIAAIGEISDWPLARAVVPVRSVVRSRSHACAVGILPGHLFRRIAHARRALRRPSAIRCVQLPLHPESAQDRARRGRLQDFDDSSSGSPVPYRPVLTTSEYLVLYELGGPFGVRLPHRTLGVVATSLGRSDSVWSCRPRRSIHQGDRATPRSLRSARMWARSSEARPGWTRRGCLQFSM